MHPSYIIRPDAHTCCMLQREIICKSTAEITGTLDTTLFRFYTNSSNFRSPRKGIVIYIYINTSSTFCAVHFVQYILCILCSTGTFCAPQNPSFHLSLPNQGNCRLLFLRSVFKCIASTHKKHIILWQPVARLYRPQKRKTGSLTD